MGPDQCLLNELDYLNSGHVRKLVGEPEVAVNSVKLFSFIPSECIGRAPTVCKPTMEQWHTSYKATFMSRKHSEVL